jgi:hypothetical protein
MSNNAKYSVQVTPGIELLFMPAILSGLKLNLCGVVQSDCQKKKQFF